MTTEIFKKQIQQRWEPIICSEGESCWCRGIIIEGTYDSIEYGASVTYKLKKIKIERKV